MQIRKQVTTARTRVMVCQRIVFVDIDREDSDFFNEKRGTNGTLLELSG